MLICSSPIKAAVDGDSGFFTGLSVKSEEVQLIKGLIIDHLKELANKSDRNTLSLENSPADLEKWFEIIEHKEIAKKESRIFSKNLLNTIRGISLFDHLKSEYGEFQISDEENIGHEEIYFRVVRPGIKTDIGPIHADTWFWDLGHGITPPGVKRVKVWMAICSEPGYNGLLVVPGSHKKAWKYHGELRDGFVKPQIDEDESNLNTYLVETAPGDAIVFNDRLLHGGVLNRGKSIRVSIEFTMFVK